MHEIAPGHPSAPDEDGIGQNMSCVVGELYNI